MPLPKGRFPKPSLSHVKVLSPIKLCYQAKEEFYSERPLLVFGGQCHWPLPY